MTDISRNDVLGAAYDEVADELQGMPLLIEREDGEDFVLVSAETYNGLVARIHELEQLVETDEERAADQEEMLSLLKNGRAPHLGSTTRPRTMSDILATARDLARDLKDVGAMTASEHARFDAFCRGRDTWPEDSCPPRDTISEKPHNTKT